MCRPRHMDSYTEIDTKASKRSTMGVTSPVCKNSHDRPIAAPKSSRVRQLRASYLVWCTLRYMHIYSEYRIDKEFRYKRLFLANCWFVSAQISHRWGISRWNLVSTMFDVYICFILDDCQVCSTLTAMPDSKNFLCKRDNSANSSKKVKWLVRSGWYEKCFLL